MKFDLGSMRRSATDRECEGVCGGLGEHTPVPSWAWRVLFICGACFSGWFLVVYLVLSHYMPGPANDMVDTRNSART